jgi:hypothetical protein
MTLRDTIEADAVNVFANQNDFAEPITYYPRDGASRSIIGVVFRNPVSPIGEVFDAVADTFEVHVVNSQTVGIWSSELDRGGDMLGFPAKIGDDACRHGIVRLIDHDEGMLILECR